MATNYTILIEIIAFVQVFGRRGEGHMSGHDDRSVLGVKQCNALPRNS